MEGLRFEIEWEVVSTTSDGLEDYVIGRVNGVVVGRIWLDRSGCVDLYHYACWSERDYEHDIEHAKYEVERLLEEKFPRLLAGLRYE